MKDVWIVITNYIYKNENYDFDKEDLVNATLSREVLIKSSF